MEIKIKAVEPEKTINKILHILKNCGCECMINDNEPIDGIYSCHVLLKGMPEICANGKGVTKELSRASGLSELMERIQDTGLFYPYYYDERLVPSDKRELLWKDLKSNVKMCLFGAFGNSQWSDITSFSCIKFIDILNNNKEIYLPYDILWHVCGSNGVCAGNTPEEAMNQGLCEIFERYVLKQVYKKDIEAYLLTSDTEKELPIYNKIQYLRKIGFQIELLDFSEDGNWPVAGIIVSKDGKSALNLGSAPHFHIAFERCFTEFFQGIENIEKMEAHRLVRVPEYEQLNKEEKNRIFLKALQQGWGIDRSYIKLKKQSQVRTASLESYRMKDFTSRETFLKLIAAVKKKGYSIYLRDLSFLGYPSFRIYIPGMSEVNKITSKIFISKKEKMFYEKLKIDLSESPYNVAVTELLLDLYNDGKEYFSEEYMFNSYIQAGYISGIRKNNDLNNLALYIIWLLYKNRRYDEAIKFTKKTISVQLHSRVFKSIDILIEILIELEQGKQKSNIFDKLENYYFENLNLSTTHVTNPLINQFICNLGHKIKNYNFNNCFK